MEVILEVDEQDGSVERTVYIDNKDQCVWCEQQYGCPLIECLANGLVYSEQPISVIDCPHYKMYDR